MLGVRESVAFIAVTDLDAAASFYGEQLGLEVRDERPHALVLHVGGTTVRIAKVERVSPPSYTVLGFTVADIVAAVGDLASRGVALVRYDSMDQDDLGIWASPSGARVAWFRDPDGSTLSLTQPAPS